MATPVTQIVLITGTSTGIGFLAALTFAGDKDKRYKVYATMRNMEQKKGDLEKAAGDLLNSTLVIKEMDVGIEASRVKCVEDILEEEERIDILINNAMVNHLGLFESIDYEKDGMEKFQVNFFGPMRLMQLVIPGMKVRKYGKILNISSIAALLPNPFLDLYSQTKRALEAASESVAVTLRPFNVWVSVLQLGAVATPRALQLKGAYEQYGDAVLNPTFETDAVTKERYVKQMKLLIDIFYDKNCQTNEEVCEFIKKTAEIDKPLLYYQSSEFARKIAAKTYVDPTGEERVKLHEDTVLSLAE